MNTAPMPKCQIVLYEFECDAKSREPRPKLRSPAKMSSPVAHRSRVFTGEIPFRRMKSSLARTLNHPTAAPSLAASLDEYDGKPTCAVDGGVHTQRSPWHSSNEDTHMPRLVPS